MSEERSNTDMSKKVLFLAGDAVEVLEIYYPYYRVQEEGYEAVIAAPSKKVLNTVCHDFVAGWETYTEKPAHLIQADIAFADVNPEDYDAVFIPGGRAPEQIRTNPELPRILSHFIDTDKPIGTICHAALVFACLPDKSYFTDRIFKAYTACQLDVEALGATYPEEMVAVDGNLVSGHAWPDLPGVLRAFLQLVRASEAVQTV
jgi:protease I